MSALLAAIVGTVLAYPPHGLWPCAAIMLAPLAAALEGRSPRAAFALAHVYTTLAALWIVRWFLVALTGEYGVPGAPAFAFTLLLVAGYATIPAAAAAAYAALQPRFSRGLAPVALAALWSLAEWVRSEPGGLPWILAGHALATVPLALQVADLGGVYAVSFVLVALNAGIGLALRHRDPRPLVVPCILLAIALAYGAACLVGAGGAEGAPPPPGPGSTAPVRVGIVQAAVPQAERFQPGSAERNTRRHAGLTRELARRLPLDLVVWSETAVDEDLDAHPALRESLEELVRETGVPLVTGAPRSAGGRHTNAVVLVTPAEGLAESYDKQRLVPFSEYDPAWLGFLAPLLGPVTEGEPYVPGSVPRVFERALVPFAAPVCFEITYPSGMRAFRSAGAELVVNLSNDAWFGPTGYPGMHFAHAVLRAVELRSFVVRGANTGISGVVDPQGRIVASLDAFEEGTLAADVWPAGAPPFYARHGDAPVLAFLAGSVALATLRGRGRKRDP